jgi:hypothetical protein
MTDHATRPAQCRPTRAVAPLLLASLFGSAGVCAQADLCGCAGDAASRGAFDSADQDSFAAASAVWDGGQTVTIAIPDDGRIVFDSFRVDETPNGQAATIRFAPPADVNPPVTLLAAGPVDIGSRGIINLNGDPGGSLLPDSGGRGGPGGFRGGDGAYPEINFATHGGAGFGPGGGLGGTGGDASQGIDPGLGQGGSFVGIDQLTPLLGGGGGGGGGATDLAGTNCRGAPGGGGGGAILIVANQAITVDGVIQADGGWSSSIGTA